MLYVALLHAKEMSLQNLKWEVGSASQFPGSKQDSQLSLPDIFKKKKATVPTLHHIQHLQLLSPKLCIKFQIVFPSQFSSLRYHAIKQHANKYIANIV